MSDIIDDKFIKKFIDLCYKYSKKYTYFANIISLFEEKIKSSINDIIKEINIENIVKSDNSFNNLLDNLLENIKNFKNIKNQSNEKSLNNFKYKIICRLLNHFVASFFGNESLSYEVIKFYIKLGFDINKKNINSNSVFSSIKSHKDLSKMSDKGEFNIYNINCSHGNIILKKIKKLEKLGCDYSDLSELLVEIINYLSSNLSGNEIHCIHYLNNIFDQIIFILKKSNSAIFANKNILFCVILQFEKIIIYKTKLIKNKDISKKLIDIYHLIFINSYCEHDKFIHFNFNMSYLSVKNKDLQNNEDYDTFTKHIKNHTYETMKSFELILLSRHFESNSLFALLPLDIFKIIMYDAFYMPVLFKKQIKKEDKEENMQIEPNYNDKNMWRPYFKKIKFEE